MRTKDLVDFHRVILEGVYGKKGVCLTEGLDDSDPDNTNPKASTPKFDPNSVMQMNSAGDKASTATPVAPAAPATPKAVDPASTTTPNTDVVTLPEVDTKPASSNTATSDTPNVDTFKFGSAMGSNKVTAAELQKYRDYTGQNSTLGQYMNDRDGKTARAGSANDQADQNQASAIDLVSSLPKTTTLKNLPPAAASNAADLIKNLPTTTTLKGLPAATPTATANSTSAANTPTQPATTYTDRFNPTVKNALNSIGKFFTSGSTKPPVKNADEVDNSDMVESVNEINKTNNNNEGSNMTRSSLIEGFLNLQNNSPANLFEAAKKQRLEEGLAQAQGKIHDTKGKDFAVGHFAGKTKEKDPMPKLQPKYVESKLATVNGHVTDTSKAAPEPMKKLKIKGMEKWLKGDGVAESTDLDGITLEEAKELISELSKKTLGSYVDKSKKSEDDVYKEAGKKLGGYEPNKDLLPSRKERDTVRKRENGQELAKKKLTKEEIELEEAFNAEYKDRLVEAKAEADVPAEFKKGFVAGYSGSNSEGKATKHYFKGYERGKSEMRMDNRSGKYYKGNASNVADRYSNDYCNYGMGSIYESTEVDEELFTEEEIERLNAILEAEGEAPVKRGRGRPPGSKSGSKMGERTEEGDGYGTKNLAAQIRPGNAPYFKDGTEVKKLTHPTKGTTHEIALKHINKFSDDYTEAAKPRDKEAVEAAFLRKHMGG